MMIGAEKREIAKQLQARVNAMQGLGKVSRDAVKSDFSPFNNAFPDKVFPLGTIHEFISHEPADAAATNAFITAITGKFIKEGGICLWIANERKVFPAALKYFGIAPDRIIFINAAKQKDMLWITEEALKCDALTAVITEIKELGFSESRRLQLAVESSGVTGFVHRHRPHHENAVACTTRWKITPLASIIVDNLPGIGHARWDVQLTKVKNGRPDAWQISWKDRNFIQISEAIYNIEVTQERTA